MNNKRVHVVKLVAMASYGYLLLKSLKNERKKRSRVRAIYMERREDGFFETIYKVIKSSDHEMFQKTFRMGVSSFNVLLGLVHERLQKVSIRKHIETECRLALTLMYLAYGVPHQILALKFRMGISTVAKIILETSQILWDVLSPIYLKVKCQEDWTQIAKEFEGMWNMENCVGAIDGKYIHMVCPANAGSEFLNYKHRRSIILMAVCDANCQFTAIDIGALGNRSEGGVFAQTSFGERLLRNTLDLPPKKVLTKSSLMIPHYFVGNAAFPLKINLMRPFPGRNLTEQQEYFNRRLSMVRTTIENAFGFLSCRWRVLLHDINCHQKNVTKIIRATVVLHNYLRKECVEYYPPNIPDNDIGESMHEGQRRQKTRQLQSASPFGKSNNATISAFAMREQLCQYVYNNK